MIQNKCDHEWIYKNDYVPSGGGQIQPMYGCAKCNKQLPASEVFQLEALENQNQTLNYLTGFQKKMLIMTTIISIVSTVALIISLIIK